MASTARARPVSPSFCTQPQPISCCRAALRAALLSLLHWALSILVTVQRRRRRRRRLLSGRSGRSWRMSRPMSIRATLSTRPAGQKSVPRYPALPLVADALPLSAGFGRGSARKGVRRRANVGLSPDCSGVSVRVRWQAYFAKFPAARLADLDSPAQTIGSSYKRGWQLYTQFVPPTVRCSHMVAHTWLHKWFHTLPRGARADPMQCTRLMTRV